MNARTYQRRRRRPVAALVAVLAVAALTTWAVVLLTAGRAAGGTSCPAPAAGTAPGTVVPAATLTAVAPVAPTTVKVRVLNAGGQRGQANLVAAQLGDLGFGTAAPPGNDPLFPRGDLKCLGQIRYGPAGEAAASTVALLLPCAEFVKDGRKDATVDVAVGTAFGDLNPGHAAKQALEQLGGPATGSTGSTNADPGGGGGATPATAVVDPGTLATARTCA